MAFSKAVKSKAFLRCALFGPSGSGKTYSALAVATGIAEALGTKIAVLDSERMSASKYGDRFDFDADELREQTIDECEVKIKEAAKEKYGVLIIDSLTHPWQQLQEEMEKVAKASFKGNYWAAWSKGTPKQRRFINALNSYPGHLIVTMRSKTEWETDPENKKPIRIGLAPEQGKGIEYEFDMLIELSVDHIANIIKDRTGKFQDKIIEKPGLAFGADLVAWLMDGAAPKEKTVEDLVKALPFDLKKSLPKVGLGGLEDAVVAFRSCDCDVDTFRQMVGELTKKKSKYIKKAKESAAESAPTTATPAKIESAEEPAVSAVSEADQEKLGF